MTYENCAIKFEKYDIILILCFSVLCVLHLQEPRIYYKIGRLNQIAGNLSDPKKLRNFWETRFRKKVTNLPILKNRISPVFNLSKIERASLPLVNMLFFIKS